MVRKKIKGRDFLSKNLLGVRFPETNNLMYKPHAFWIIILIKFSVLI